MNINIDIVARALNKAGEEPLTKEEIETKKGTRWRLIQDIYLATILEELSAVNWTSQKKRAALLFSDEDNLTSYPFMYDLPIDCAKTVGLNSEKEYLVEDGHLYTEDPSPILIYIRNYFIGKYEYKEPEQQPVSDEEIAAGSFYKLVEEEYVKAESYEEGVTYYIIDEQDYDFYSNPKFDPLLEDAIVTKMAMKIVIKLTGNSTLYQFLYQDAVLMESRAQKASEAHGHNKGKGNKTWGELMGLPNYGED